MSPSEYTTIDAVAYASCDDNHSAPNTNCTAGSSKGHGVAVSMPTPIYNGVAAENSEVPSRTTNEDQPKIIPNISTETTSLASQFAQLRVKNGDDGHNPSSSVAQKPAAIDEVPKEHLNTLHNPRIINKNERKASWESLIKKDKVSDSTPGTRRSLLAAVTEPSLPMLSKQEPPKPGFDAIGRADEQDLAEFPEAVGTAPLDPSPGWQGEQPEGYIAPPPSPMNPAAKVKADFEELFEIRRSTFGGLGAFAVRELKRGQTVLAERPLLRTTHFRLMPDYYNLSDAAKKAYLSLHGGKDGDRFGRVERVKVLNSFRVPRGIAIFELASRFNHACPSARNVQYVFDDEREVLSLTICQDVVPAGAELFISYGGSPAELYSTYGFRCACGGCTPLTDEDIRRLKSRQFSGGDCSDEYDTSDW